MRDAETVSVAIVEDSATGKRTVVVIADSAPVMELGPLSAQQLGAALVAASVDIQRMAPAQKGAMPS